MPSATPVAGRNDPCPCGSGKRYKQCHGALAVPTAPADMPQTPEALTRQGMAAHQAGDLDGAERHYRAVLASSPDFPPALHYLGVVLYQRSRMNEALPLLDRAATLVPHEPEFHNNRGLALAAAGRDSEAIAAYRRALALKPDHVGALSNLGLALQATGDVEGAIAAYRRGLLLAPEFPQLHWNLALALLLRGDMAEGWREYEWRLKTPELAPFLHRYADARWTGDDPAGRTILLTAEQGLGDALQNLRFASVVAGRGARVVVAVPDALRNLAATVPGVASAHALEAALPHHDAQLSLMSLPGALRIALADIDVPVPYMRADPARLAEARQQVAQAAGNALKVGVAWTGAPGNSLNAKRSVPLAAFAPLLDLPGVCWFSLKREGEAIPLADATCAKRLVELDLRNDFDGLAALVDSLDVVISVDTSLAHLAGALGKPVWVLLAKVPDWRWFLDRADSPWYPSARLYRQQVAGDWSGPLRDVGAALCALANDR